MWGQLKAGPPPLENTICYDMTTFLHFGNVLFKNPKKTGIIVLHKTDDHKKKVNHGFIKKNKRR